MKLILRFSFALTMVFLFSFPQCSIASKNLQQIPKKITEKYIAKENLDKIKIAQRQRRPGPRGGMGQRGRMSRSRGGMSGERGRMSGPRGGMRRQNGGGEASIGESAGGASKMQSGQSMGEVEPGTSSPRRGSKFRNKRRMRNRMRQRMQRRGRGPQGQALGQDGENGQGVFQNR